MLSKEEFEKLIKDIQLGRRPMRDYNDLLAAGKVPEVNVMAYGREIDGMWGGQTYTADAYGAPVVTMPDGSTPGPTDRPHMGIDYSEPSNVPATPNAGHAPYVITAPAGGSVLENRPAKLSIWQRIVAFFKDLFA